MTAAPVMRRLRWTDLDDTARRRLFDRGLSDIVAPDLQASIAELIDDVRTRGDDAICDATARFDGIGLAPEQLRVTDDELDGARVAPELDAAIDEAIVHLRAFNEHLRLRASDWQLTLEPGLVVGEKITPVASAALFVPSGKASYPSVAYQLGVPAVVAGVPELVVVVPPVPGGRGEVDPAVLVVCRKLGLRTVVRGNGPACIAGVGLGTQHLPKVRKIVGPGSPAVTCAQVEMQRHGVVTMMVLGPTEAMVIADDTADVERLAADLLIEAEHGADSTVFLVTTSQRLADMVDNALERHLGDLPVLRAEAARAALGTNGGCVVVRDLPTAVEVANRFAPEHLQVAVAHDAEDSVVDALVDAGEILVGQHTPFSAANFVIGCPASLPTSGFAKVSSGITVEAFLKRTALARCDEQTLAGLAPAIVALADHEGFPAHAAALRRRFP
jgi:histidinol dehydrogenase